jgi:FkbM family methyltransferase
MIANISLQKLSEQQNIFTTGIKMLEQYKLSLRAGRCKKEDDSVVNYIEKSIEGGYTILDIGPQEGNYIYFMRRKLKQSGKIIAFESQPFLHQHLGHLKKILDWKNVELELIRLSNVAGTEHVHHRLNGRNNSSLKSAIVINMNEDLDNYFSNKIAVQTLDNYCESRSIKPNFIRIDDQGNELKILQGAVNILKNYKPKLLVKCEERIAGTQKVLETFKLLKQLNYTGYFVLDTLRIPLTNFDFSVYQNAYNNFYCSNFIFE